MDLSYAGDATLRDNVITHECCRTEWHRTWGGVYGEGDIYDNEIVANTASINNTGYGGGVYAYHVANFERNNVLSNIASQNGDGTGGGIYIIYLHTAAQNTIMYNEATRGGGVYYNTYTGEEDFYNNFVSHNSATGTNDATQDGGGGIASAANRVNITGNTITNNTAQQGGGIQIVAGTLYVLQTNQVKLNTSIYGGGIYVTNAGGTIEQNVIFDNEAVLGGDVSGACCQSGDRGQYDNQQYR